jgi:hypothetical protein
MPASLFIGFPLLAIAIPGSLVILYQKSYATFIKTRKDEWPELQWNLLFLLIAWIICVFGLYMMYEWTSPQAMENTQYFIKARFYLPGLLPVVILTALVMSRWAKQLVAGLLVVSFAAGIMIAVTAAPLGPGGAKLPVQQPLPGVQQPLLPGVQQPSPPGLQQPVLPPQQGAGSIDFINRIRQEVIQSGTNRQNLQVHDQALMLWTLSLSNQGLPVKQIMPLDRLWKIQNMMTLGNLDDAARSVDQAFKDLEKLVSGK